MNKQIEKIIIKSENLRQQIINHEVYSYIKNIDDLKIFMQYHVFAVWDFMSLLKSLQNELTCTSVPWFPKGSAENRNLINEIVVGEESDLDPEGNRKSHFELYLESMQQCGADISQIELFVETLKKTGNFEEAYNFSNTPIECQSFVNFTFDVIKSNKAHSQAAIFTFGREDLIPSMFFSIVNDLNKEDSISKFKYYLDRHIEIDGDEHSHLALKMTSNLCEENVEFWLEAEIFTLKSLEKRIELWDGVLKQIKQNKKASAEISYS
jgi:hypothetical protein